MTNNRALKTCVKCGGVHLTVPGEPASKSNSRTFVRINNMPRLIKSKKALSYEKIWKTTVGAAETLMTGDVVLHVTIYYASRRPDLDESLIMDLLQGRVIENDRQIKEKHVYWALDKDNPRAEIVITHRSAASSA